VNKTAIIVNQQSTKTHFLFDPSRPSTWKTSEYKYSTFLL